MLFGTGNGSKDEYTLKKLESSHNYKQWTQAISLPLEKSRLWRYIKETAVAPPSLKPNDDDSVDRMEKIFAKEEKICKFEKNARKAIAKIGKICTETV